VQPFSLQLGSICSFQLSTSLTTHTHFHPLVLYKFQVLQLLSPHPPLICQHQQTSFLLVNNLVVHFPPRPSPQLSLPHLVCIHICTLATFSLPPFNWHIQQFECPIFLLSFFSPPLWAHPFRGYFFPTPQTKYRPENY